MVRRILVTVVFLVFGVCYAIHDCSSQMQPSFGVNGGISKPLSEGGEYWNVGFSMGGNVLYPVSPNVFLGLRVGYNRWTPDEEELVAAVADIDPGISWDISGSATFIEIVPSMRIVAPTLEGQKVAPFLHLGFGIFLMRVDSTIRASYMGSTGIASAENSENKPGLSLGGGIMIGEAGNVRFEIFPLYHIIFTKDDTTEYFSLNFGIASG